MPKNIRPRVNEAREFLEIAKDFKDPREIIREALSNSWDAGATEVSIKFSFARITGSRKNKIQVEIHDDGKGMSSELRPTVNSSEIEGFFNLGDSDKPAGSIGSKGHGTKIYYKSMGVAVDTWKNGRRIHATIEVPPWDSLLKGQIPTYRYDESDDNTKHGTSIFIDDFQAKQSTFMSLDELKQYINWFTVVGSFSHYFGIDRTMTVKIQPANAYSPVILPFGFSLPPDQTDIDGAVESACKLFGPRTISCGITEDGREVFINVVAALLGEDHRNIVPHTYSHMGLWLCKDYMRIERKNEILEDVFKGQYYYRSMLIFANCQSFDLTANRNNIRTDQEEYDLAISGIKGFCSDIRSDSFTEAYFQAKKNIDNDKKREEAAKTQADRTARRNGAKQDRINAYKGRSDSSFNNVKGYPVKEPKNEAETALLLQAMISSSHPGVDFTIGDYNTSNGVDLIIEMIDKGIPTIKWAELVSSLDRLFAWDHPVDGYHVIICYELGKAKEKNSFPNGTNARLVRKEKRGRYALIVGSDSIDIYVLREILGDHASM